MFLSPGKTWIIDHPSGDRKFISKRFFRVRDFFRQDGKENCFRSSVSETVLFMVR